jgi:DNA-binding CsgD family transcriptional regulator
MFLPSWLQRLFKKKKGLDRRAFASEVEALELVSLDSQSFEIFPEDPSIQGNPASNPQHGNSLPVGRRSTDKYDTELYDCWLSLSVREQQVVALTCLGYKNQQIAFKLGLSTTTVKSYIQNVCNKLGLHSKTEIRLTFVNWDFSEWR